MRDRIRAGILAGPLLLLGAGAGAQQEPAYSIDLAAERNRLELPARDAQWWTHRAQFNARQSAGAGWFVAAETQKRERTTDAALGAGAYRRVGPWLWSGQVSSAPGADFLPRYAIEPRVEIGMGNSAVVIGWIYKSFAASRVRIANFGVAHYVGDSEIEFRLAYGDSRPFDRHIRVATLRGVHDPGGAWTVGATASIGKGLYDILNVPGTSGNRGWSTSFNLRYRLDKVHSLRLDIGAGHEKPRFRERRIGLSFRKTF